MSSNNPEMIDMVFDLEGFILPVSYPFTLWEALVNLAPELVEAQSVGVLPLKATRENEGMLLSKRAKLALRLPKEISGHIAAQLSGNTIHFDPTSSLSLGKFRSRNIEAYPTIHAHLVTGPNDEVLFMDEVRAQLNELNIVANLICGKRSSIGDDQKAVQGFSLVAHDLKPEASLKLQYSGLGELHQFGCGIFIPYKEISGLSDE